MHVKIQGGGEGKYSNSGSCSSLVSYLEHEDLERIEKNESVENFFSHTNNNVDGNFIIDCIDNNRKKLCKNDAKFFVITVNLSDKENQHLKKYEGGISQQIKNFVRNDVMQKYAENFNKGLRADDLMYFAKIHHDRKKDSQNKLNAHCHIIVSRKTLNGKIRISPMTNHVNTTQGATKGGFSRINFYDKIEKSFDNRFIYPREFMETFEYHKRMKKAKPDEIMLLSKQQLTTKDDKLKQLREIEKICDKFHLDNETKDQLLKGYAYEISGSFYSENTKQNINLDKEIVSIELKNDKFELMAGKESWNDRILQLSLSNGIEDYTSLIKKRKFGR